MNCDRARDLMSAYIDGELAGDERRTIAAHIDTCASCAELARDFRRIGSAMAATGREPLTPVLANRIAAQLAAEVATTVVTLPVRPVPSHLRATVWRQVAAFEMRPFVRGQAPGAAARALADHRVFLMMVEQACVDLDDVLPIEPAQQRGHARALADLECQGMAVAVDGFGHSFTEP